MKYKKYDIIVVGGGPGGYHAASLLGKKGKHVLLVEKKQLGGCCVNKGCIPTKLLIQKSNVQSGVRWSDVQEALQDMLAEHREGIQLLLSSWHVETVFGEAQVIGTGKVSVDGEVITCQDVILATGAKAMIPELFLDMRMAGGRVVPADLLWDEPDLPDNIAIVGGGMIGCELACALSDMGKHISIIEKDELLGGVFDRQALNSLKRSFKKKKIDLYTGCCVNNYQLSIEGAIDLGLDGGKMILCDMVILATGRRADVSAVTYEDWKVDPHLHVIGDASGKMQTAYYARYQAELVADRLVGLDDAETLELKDLPICVFTSPQMAKIGLSKEEAKERGLLVQVGKAPYYAVGMAKIYGDTSGYIQVVRDSETDLLVGAKIVGHGACEMIHLLQTYIVQKIPCNQIKRQIFAHPTLGEGVKIAMEEACEGSVDITGKE